MEDTSRTCIIVVELTAGGHKDLLGIVVDEVAEVLDIPKDSIQPGIGAAQGFQSECLAGVGVVDNEVKLLLDINQVVSPGELARITQLAQQG